MLAGEPENNRNIFGVGDEDQSVYRFRGADYRNVLRFREVYPEAKVVLLEQNYRSTQTILDVANCRHRQQPCAHAQDALHRERQGPGRYRL